MPKKQTPKQIHQQYEIADTSYRVAIAQKYVKVSDEWKFHGYICIACDNGFKFESSLTKHKKTCKVLNKLKEKKDANTKNSSEG
jgi:hypothetical protein